MTKYTTTSIISPSKGNEYCPAGEQVEVVHSCGNVAICEWKGERFPCAVGKLSDVKPAAHTAPVTKKVSDKDAKLLEEYNRLKR
jgi:hypothetical protein